MTGTLGHGSDLSNPRVNEDMGPSFNHSHDYFLKDYEVLKGRNCDYPL